MREIQLNYRVKLDKSFVFKHPLFKILKSDGLTEDFDIQMIDENGEIVVDFANASLSVENSLEGRTTLYFSDDIANDALENEFLYGVCDSNYRPFIVNSSKIFNYSVYEGEISNTFYVTRGDLQEFSSDYACEIADIWTIYLQAYLLFYGGIMNAEVVSITLSEDRKVGKVKTRGFYRLEDVSQDPPSKLNRILPS